jgi:hypothetical protein
LLDLTPGELSGQALGLQSSGMLALQGVGAALAGAVAELTSPAAGIALMAVASLAVTAALTPGLRRPATRPVEEPARTRSAARAGPANGAGAVAGRSSRSPCASASASASASGSAEHLSSSRSP